MWSRAGTPNTTWPGSTSWVTTEPAPVTAPTAASYRPSHPQPPDADAIRDAARLLMEAVRPLILAGGGVNWASAGAEVVRLSEHYAIPMITAYGRNDAVP